jgi:polyhydroxybutyrate depolymerase
MILAFIAALMISGTAFADAPAQAECNPALAAVTPGDSTRTLESGGMTRSYLLHVPPDYDHTRPTPLVLSLHGFASNATQQEFFSKWDEIADEENFLVVYPQGDGMPPRWNGGPSIFTRRNPVDDVGFIRDLIAQVSVDYCVDAARVYVNGLSNGGGMTHRLACELADVIAAVGTVAGAYPRDTDDCEPARPISVMAFHGTDDPIVPYDGSAIFPVVEDWVAEWAVRDGCDAAPEIIAATGDASGVRYVNCDAGGEVIFYTIDGGGHTWPGGNPIPEIIGGKTSEDISASATMWTFFQAHPLDAT